MLKDPSCAHCGVTLGFPFDPDAVDWIKSKVPTKLEGAEIPAWIIALPDERLLTRSVYWATGCVLASWELPRRQIPLELAMRIEWYIKAGGKYFTADLTPMDLDAECFDPYLDQDPSCKIFSDWPSRAKKGLIQKAPKANRLELIRLVNLALRTPPCGFAM